MFLIFHARYGCDKQKVRVSLLFQSLFTSADIDVFYAKCMHDLPLKVFALIYCERDPSLIHTAVANNQSKQYYSCYKPYNHRVNETIFVAQD